MTSYNKLVRDHIPEIIEQRGGRPVVRTLNDGEYQLALQAKLVEEWGEFLATPSVEEFADVLEVLRAVAVAFGYDWDAVQTARRHKRDERGGFDARLFLEAVEEGASRAPEQ